MNPSDGTNNIQINTDVEATGAVDLVEVIRKLRSGSTSLSEEGLSDFLHHFERQVRGIAMHILHNSSYADDVIANFRKRSWEELSTFSGTTAGELTNWTRQVAIHLSIDERKRHVRDPLQLTAKDYETGLLERQEQRREFLGRPKRNTRSVQEGKYRVQDVTDFLSESSFLQHKLRFLSPNERSCVKLRADGFKNPQIADKLGIPTKTVACHVSRGCKKLVAFIIEQRRGFRSANDLRLT